ncbi:RING finger and CHY zinc finger domain-containing protein 1 isoform X3 [Aedes albopictus]|uniref:Gustatory receptor n=1 Tax=Aedes albopictus TaxID=7160 RepID=A0ABM1ZJG3_AEDAL|nr:RING finger and CHY zinc finger domain-containing protein 1-like isoform X2 [Aedes albopictus]XP_029708542.1 RING finger and CHY zinc finger domain-containing protein 1 isoform X2 [Aedes albopictus]
MASTEQTQSKENPEEGEKRVGCAHYKRRAKFVTPCCNKFYMCRYCHDENETHFFNRRTVTELICTECNWRQRVQAQCEMCGVRFGRYTCLVCNLFDDEDRNQYHCEGCGICRVGGRGRFFHCKVCNMCLPMQLQVEGHKCVENVSRSNCPVCLDDIHTSRIPCHIPFCGHLLHRTCFEELLSSGHYACPTCQTSMMDMNQLWEYLDAEVAATPMPKEYENYIVDILCKDCHKSNKTSEILHRYNSLHMDAQLKQTVEMFLIQLMHHPIKFTACGMFTLDYSVLFSIITSATSYLIILIQFELADNCKKV